MNNMSEATAQYIGITGGRIDFDSDIQQYAQPVVNLSGASRGAGGLGITSYECIAGGAKFKFRFMMPKRGFLTYTQFVGWLMKYAANSPRGLSNARSNEWGFVEILERQVPRGDAHGEGGDRASARWDEQPGAELRRGVPGEDRRQGSSICSAGRISTQINRASGRSASLTARRER